MSYSTNAKIREEAGFTGNTNVTNANITTYQDPATNFINGIVSRVYELPFATVPDIIELIERKLAAGHLLLEEYGDQAEGTSKDGAAKVKWAEDTLKMIENGTMPLVDASGVESAVVSRVNLSGFPVDSTGTDKTTDKDDPTIFEVGKKF